MLDAEWHIYRPPLSVPHDLPNTLRRIHAASPGTRVTVIGSVPRWPPSLPVYAVRRGATLAQPAYLPMPGYDLVHSVDADVAAVVAKAAGVMQVRYVSALDLVCRAQDKSCLAVVPVPKAPGTNALAARDNGHLTEAGAYWLAGK